MLSKIKTQNLVTTKFLCYLQTAVWAKDRISDMDKLSKIMWRQIGWSSSGMTAKHNFQNHCAQDCADFILFYYLVYGIEP